MFSPMGRFDILIEEEERLKPLAPTLHSDRFFFARRASNDHRTTNSKVVHHGIESELSQGVFEGGQRRVSCHGYLVECQKLWGDCWRQRPRESRRGWLRRPHEGSSDPRVSATSQGDELRICRGVGYLESPPRRGRRVH